MTAETPDADPDDDHPDEADTAPTRGDAQTDSDDATRDRDDTTPASDAPTAPDSSEDHNAPQNTNRRPTTRTNNVTVTGPEMTDRYPRPPGATNPETGQETGNPTCHSDETGTPAAADGGTTADDPATTDRDTPPMVRVYRHDIHKLRGRSHDAAADRFAGVRVNEPVPQSADAHAALLSRPRGEPEQTVANHVSPRRLSLRTGAPAQFDDGASAIDQAVRDLARIETSGGAHAAWLDADVPALFNESVYYPYTSAKYHVLLTAALLSNYRQGASFDDLALVVDPPDTDPIPHRTILTTDTISLRLTCEPDDRPAAPLGARPAQSWADVWARLPSHPLATDGNRPAMVLDAQLRRIRSWSVALQYIEDSLAVPQGSEVDR